MVVSLENERFEICLLVLFETLLQLPGSFDIGVRVRLTVKDVDRNGKS